MSHICHQYVQSLSGPYKYLSRHKLLTLPPSTQNFKRPICKRTSQKYHISLQLLFLPSGISLKPSLNYLTILRHYKYQISRCSVRRQYVIVFSLLVPYPHLTNHHNSTDVNGSKHIANLQHYRKLGR